MASFCTKHCVPVHWHFRPKGWWNWSQFVSVFVFSFEFHRIVSFVPTFLLSSSTPFEWTRSGWLLLLHGTDSIKNIQPVILTKCVKINLLTHNFYILGTFLVISLGLNWVQICLMICREWKRVAWIFLWGFCLKTLFVLLVFLWTLFCIHQLIQ